MPLDQETNISVFSFMGELIYNTNKNNPPKMKDPPLKKERTVPLEQDILEYSCCMELILH